MTRSQTARYHGRQHVKLPENWTKQVRDYNKWKRSTKKTGGRRHRKTHRRHTRRH
jgi:hypothetical protein